MRLLLASCGVSLVPAPEAAGECTELLDLLPCNLEVGPEPQPVADLLRTGDVEGHVAFAERAEVVDRAFIGDELAGAVGQVRDGRAVELERPDLVRDVVAEDVGNYKFDGITFKNTGTAGLVVKSAQQDVGARAYHSDGSSIWATDSAAANSDFGRVFVSDTGVSATKVNEIHQDMGLDISNPKTITQNTEGSDYSESVDSMTKTVVKTGPNTVITRTA